MAHSKRYYWLKLHDDFFDSLRIKKLRRLAGGDTYTIIYLKMQLKAIKSDGYLQFTGLEEDFASELALDIDEDPDNVRVTLTYLTSCGLIECSDDINFFIPYAIENTGSETTSAQRVREHREKSKVLHCNNDVTPMKQNCNGEKDKEKETRDRAREEKKSTRHKYGEYKNVLLSDEELEKLKIEFPDWETKIERLSSYIAQSGKSYKNHLATIRNWARRDKEQQGQPQGSFDVDEFFNAALKRSYEQMEQHNEAN